MQLSLNWLKEFAAIPKSITPEELASRLTMHTVEVEKISYQADKFKGVVAGKILQVKPHPNADRLRLAKVDIGTEKLEIVCGATNIKPGQFAPVALAGTILPNGLEIKAAEIRGVKSYGMLCAADELGLGQDHSEIVILEKAKAGQNFAEYLGLTDVIFEVDNKSITHRADLWSHYGLARDMAAFLNCKFKKYNANLRINANAANVRIKAKVEDFKLCPRYMALGMSGIKVAPSPKWLADRLAAVGSRPINNIVDITNYVMLELGQPLHAFDKNSIDEIIVRRAKAGEELETLDGLKRKLDPDMLVIADSHKPVAAAGIMGGANSEINDQTTSIILEAANFNFISVRQTAQKLGLRTEASMRFEKGLDPNLCGPGLKRAAELIRKICPGARVAGKPTDMKRLSLLKEVKPPRINFDLAWLNSRIGHEFGLKYVKQVLARLGFGVKERAGKFSVTVPTWRAARDISIAEDMVEEVARIYGYNNIKSALPIAAMRPPLANQEKELERKIKNFLSAGAKMCESYNYSFISRERGGADAIKLANPLSEDLAVLRPSLLPGLLENIKTNQAQEEKISLYEIGRIFLNQPGADELPMQEKHLGLILAGPGDEDLFRELKGIIEYLFKELNLEAEFEIADTAIRLLYSNLIARAAIYTNGQAIGQVMELEKNSARVLGIKKQTAMAEISLVKLFAAVKNSPARQYAEPSKYPAAVRDLAFVINEKILYNKVVKQIKNFSSLIKQTELFDIYHGDKLGAGKKSLAFHIIYQADRTLTSAEVDEVQSGLVKHLEKEIGAKVRDF